MFYILSFLLNLMAVEVPKMDFKTMKLDTLEKPWIAYVDSVVGKAFINRYNEDGTRIMFNFPVERYILIHSKDEINVGARGKVDILLKNNNKLSLSQNTVFKIFKHEVDLTRQDSLFSLLWGTVKASVNRLTPDSDYRMQTPNATIGVRGTEFLTQYSGLTKTTKVACMSGLVSVKTVMDAKEEVVREQLVKPNEYMSVETVFENGVSTNQAKEPKTFTKQLLAGVDAVFDTSETDTINPWKYQELSTSYLRFGGGAGYFIFKNNHVPLTVLSYMPIVKLYDFIYLDSALHVGMLTDEEENIPNFEHFLFRIEPAISFNVWRGFLVGGGFGWNIIEPDENSAFKNDKGINFRLTYIFEDKLWDIIDGLSYRFDLLNEKKRPIHSFSIIFNLNEGRNKW